MDTHLTMPYGDHMMTESAVEPSTTSLALQNMDDNDLMDLGRCFGESEVPLVPLPDFVFPSSQFPADAHMFETISDDFLDSLK